MRETKSRVVPIGHTHPQNTLPRIMVAAITAIDANIEGIKTLAAIIPSNASNGSARR